MAISEDADTVQQITVLFSVYKLSVMLKRGEYSSLKIKFSYALLEVVFIQLTCHALRMSIFKKKKHRKLESK